MYDKEDEHPGREFYSTPRFVQHIGNHAIVEVMRLYRGHLPPGGEVLNLMSSWISHLPKEISYARMSSLGMSEEELQDNPRLDGYTVHDLNSEPTLPYATDEFDAATTCVSVDYLTRLVERLSALSSEVPASAGVLRATSSKLNARAEGTT